MNISPTWLKQKSSTINTHTHTPITKPNTTPYNEPPVPLTDTYPTMTQVMLSPVCIRICLASWDGLAKPLSQVWHTCGVALGRRVAWVGRCVWMCSLRCDERRKPFLHTCKVSKIGGQLVCFCLFAVVLRCSNSVSVISWRSGMIYEMRRTKYGSILLTTQGIFNLPHHVGMVWKEPTFWWRCKLYTAGKWIATPRQINHTPI